MSKPMMKCGHSANARTSDDKPCCAICICTEIAELPNLTGRTAFCGYGKHAEKPSSTDLAFFEHKPTEAHDNYYCGCFGWD